MIVLYLNFKCSYCGAWAGKIDLLSDNKNEINWIVLENIIIYNIFRIPCFLNVNSLRIKNLFLTHLGMVLYLLWKDVIALSFEFILVLFRFGSDSPYDPLLLLKKWRLRQIFCQDTACLKEIPLKGVEGVIRAVRPPTHCYKSAKTEKYLYFIGFVKHHRSDIYLL